MAEDAPTFKEVVIKRLDSEARQLWILASLLEHGVIGSARELRENHIPERIRALEEIAARKGEGA